MSEVLIVDGLGKRYGGAAGGSLRELLASPGRWLGARPPVAGRWALRGASFRVARGERVALLGRNGAGKSTLLKLLGRVLTPDEGEARVWGRVACMLEVGTGFHPELTGRENVFLNGIIMGMSRREIAAKLPSIAAFAEVDDALEQPLKRWSSGMQARLGFAVAAHLEPDLLVLDEVLAVGDHRFRAKCAAHLRDARCAVLLVSHDVEAVRASSTRGIVLHEGAIVVDAPVEAAISAYLAE